MAQHEEEFGKDFYPTGGCGLGGIASHTYILTRQKMLRSFHLSKGTFTKLLADGVAPDAADAREAMPLGRIARIAFRWHVGT